MNSASSAKTYIKMQGQILEDDDCACLLVEAIAKKSQNIKWSTKVDGKNVQHRLIRRVSMDQFYAILTGEEDAFYKMCMALPEVINSVVNEEGGVEVPHDTVIDTKNSLPVQNKSRKLRANSQSWSKNILNVQMHLQTVTAFRLTATALFQMIMVQTRYCLWCTK